MITSSSPVPTAVFVIGTRAQLIKLAPVIVACERVGHPALLLLTGQHHETMADLLGEFSISSPQISAIPPSERATVGSLLRWLPKAYIGVFRELRRQRKHNPLLDVVVHGDTLSAVVGAVAARHVGAQVVHVESGLSSGHILDPFPEELCRRVVFRLTDLAFCPSAEAVEYMRRNHGCIAVDTLGNTIVDAVGLAGVRAGAVSDNDYIVASLHRFQNIYSEARLGHLVDLLVDVSELMPVHFVLHPATRKRLVVHGLLERLETSPGIHLTPRLGYSAFLRMAASAACVLTDGGSNQEELATLGVPTVVMRERTERADGLGRNAIMEADLGMGVPQFLAAGLHVHLRSESGVCEGLGPSMRIAEKLAANWR